MPEINLNNPKHNELMVTIMLVAYRFEFANHKDASLLLSHRKDLRQRTSELLGVNLTRPKFEKFLKQNSEVWFNYDNLKVVFGNL